MVTVFFTVAILVLLVWDPIVALVCTFLMDIIGYLDFFFRDMPNQKLCPFLKLGYISFYHLLLRVLYMFWVLDTYKLYNLEVFSLSL